MDNMLSHPNCREILQEEEVKMHMSDKLWTSMLPRIKHFIAAVATDIRMWNIRWNFEMHLPEYIEVRGELEKTINSIISIGELLLTLKDNSGIQSVLTEKFDHARKLAIITARSINSLIEWSMVEIPGYHIDNPGPSWYQLGGSKRNPFHLYFSQEEAQELQDIVMELKQTQDVIEKFGLEMDEDEINLLLDVLTPKLEKRKNPERAEGAILTYFRRLSEYTEKYGVLGSSAKVLV